MKNKITDLNHNFISIQELCQLFHKRGNFVRLVENYIRENALTDQVTVHLKNGTKRKIPFFHLGTKEGQQFGIYLLQKAVPFFLKKHFEELIRLGIEKERLYACLEVIPSLSVEEKVTRRKELLLLGDVSLKIAKNPRIVPMLTKYIKDNLLTATYPFFNKKENRWERKNMFCFSPSSRGKCGVYLLKEALPFFLNQYQPLLKEKVNEFEEENDFLSLRGLSLYLGNSMHERKLLKFIKSHLDETVEIETQAGEKKTLPLFQTTQQSAQINIYKKGVDTFIQKYQQDLIQMGYQIAGVIAQQFSKKDLQGNLISLKKVITSLSKDKETRKNIYHYLLSSFQNQETVYNEGTQKPVRLLFYRDLLLILKEDVASFFKFHKQALLNQGANEQLLLNITQEKAILKKDKEMLTLREGGQLLKADYFKFKKLAPLFQKYFLTETYQPDPNSTAKENVFVYCKGGHGFMYYIKNKEAFLSFLKNHKEELITLGFKKELIEQVTKEKEYPVLTDDFIYLNDLKELLHIDTKKLKSYILEHCLNDTYETTDQTGTLIQKPLFLFMRGKKQRFGDYALDKRGLTQFISNRKKELKINDIVEEALSFNKPIVKKEAYHTTFPTLSELLGSSNKRAASFKSLVKKCFIHDTVQTFTNGELTQIPVFDYAYTVSGKMTLYININCLASFLNSRKIQLIQFGFKKEKIEKFLENMKKNPTIVQSKDSSHKLKRMIYLQSHPTNRQKGV